MIRISIFFIKQWFSYLIITSRLPRNWMKMAIRKPTRHLVAGQWVFPRDSWNLCPSIGIIRHFIHNMFPWIKWMKFRLCHRPLCNLRRKFHPQVAMTKMTRKKCRQNSLEERKRYFIIDFLTERLFFRITNLVLLNDVLFHNFVMLFQSKLLNQ